MKSSSAPAELVWLQALQTPTTALGWSLAEWERVVRLARRLRLLARLAERMLSSGMEPQLPTVVQRHLRAERQRSRARLRAMNWTVHQVGSVLSELPAPRVLLKGAAYVAQGLPVATGRLPSDLDILVPLQYVTLAQQRLQDHDWRTVALDPHDQRYYREWSHEIPPLHHPQFDVELDLHHGILPPVASVTVDPGLLLAQVMPSGLDGWSVFSPADQILHSAAHLFHDSEMRDRMRDLVDLDGLMRHFSQRPGFWSVLVDRSIELGLVEPLALAVHFTTAWLRTPVPAAVCQRLDRLGPGAARRAWLVPLIGAVLWPSDPDSRESMKQRLAAVAVLSRYHWGRMPLRLLLPHLWHKARRRPGAEVEAAQNA